LEIQHFIISVQQTLNKPDANLRQSDKPPKLISKLYQELIEAIPDDTKYVNLKCEEDLVMKRYRYVRMSSHVHII
jgi:hypothetical protein